MTDHRRKPYYGRSHKRQRNAGGALPAVLAVLLVLVTAGLLVFGLVPGAREKAKEYGTVVLEAAAGILNPRSGDSAAREAVQPETEKTTRYSVTEAESGELVITVIRPTESVPETEPVLPPKYTENENTRRIRRESGPDGEGGPAEETGQDADAPLTFTFAGDILFDDHYAIMASWLQRPGGTADLKNVFDDGLIARMREADVFMVNNEFPYSKGGAPLENKKFTFRADPASAKLLTAMGADIVSLANNHMYDYGEAALLDTLGTLRQEGIPFVGAGEDLEEASRPFYFTNGEVKIGIVSATQIERLANPDTKGATETSAGVFRCLNSENLTGTIRQMKTECDFVIAYLHWGTESTENIDEHQTKLAKAAAEAGADLIIGDHPHVLQKIGFVEGVPVVYSLGNYLFNSGAQDTCLVTAYLDPHSGQLLELQFEPARQEGCRTALLEGTEKDRVLDYMRSLGGAQYDEDGFVTPEE